jgi:V-type H+-transporting ATPase subunit H
MSLYSKYGIIPVLTEIAQSAVKEKVIRVVVATFRVSVRLDATFCMFATQLMISHGQNLVSKAPAQNLSAMFVVKLLPFVRNLSARKWSDDEIIEDVQYLNDELSAHFQNLT